MSALFALQWRLPHWAAMQAESKPRRRQLELHGVVLWEDDWRRLNALAIADRRSLADYAAIVLQRHARRRLSPLAPLEPHEASA